MPQRGSGVIALLSIGSVGTTVLSVGAVGATVGLAAALVPSVLGNLVFADVATVDTGVPTSVVTLCTGADTTVAITVGAAVKTAVATTAGVGVVTAVATTAGVGVVTAVGEAVAAAGADGVVAAVTDLVADGVAANELMCALVDITVDPLGALGFVVVPAIVVSVDKPHKQECTVISRIKP